MLSYTREQTEYFISVMDEYTTQDIIKLMFEKFGLSLTKTQVCSKRRHHRRNGFDASWFIPRDITCKHCGYTFTPSAERLDKRTKFCSAQCERKYWRHPPENNRATNINLYGKPDYDLRE